MPRITKLSTLNGSTVWLTGASSGIGAAFVRVLASAAADENSTTHAQKPLQLAISARRTELLEALAAEVAHPAIRVLAVPCDVTDRTSVAAAAENIQQHFGDIDLLVANAGTHKPTLVDQFDVAEYEQIMRLNFLGVLHALEPVLPAMLRRGHGHVVVVSSIAGLRALPMAAAYGASKAAVSHFMDSLRFSLQPRGIAVTVVNPGFVKTPLTDRNDFVMPCLMEAEDAARAMLGGILKRRMEVHFPRRFTLVLKLLRLLPYPLYHAIIRRMVRM